MSAAWRAAGAKTWPPAQEWPPLSPAHRCDVLRKLAAAVVASTSGKLPQVAEAFYLVTNGTKLDPDSSARTFVDAEEGDAELMYVPLLVFNGTYHITLRVEHGRAIEWDKAKR